MFNNAAYSSNLLPNIIAAIISGYTVAIVATVHTMCI